MKGFPWTKFKFTNEPGDLTNVKASRMSLRGDKAMHKQMHMVQCYNDSCLFPLMYPYNYVAY